MSCRSCAPVCTVLALFVVLSNAADNDFWCSKPYTEWNEKEVQKLLKDSPWSRPITISLGSMGGGGGRARGGGGGGGFPRGGAIGVEDGDMGGGSAGRGGAGEPAIRTMDVVASWYSSPVRQAMARSIILRNPEPPREQLEKLLNYPETPYFDILVIGWTAPRENAEKEIGKLREETCLEKKNKERIALADIIMPKGRGQPLVLLFPKSVDGKPTITLEDKEVTLRTRVAQSTVRARFKLSDMIIGGKPAL